ncbi:MAG: DUF2341 domain-containing protein [Proteobacteria bacterium]|nr:DUF2341 domain-containing protein [Pseudomonadota bacterium]
MKNRTSNFCTMAKCAFWAIFIIGCMGNPAWADWYSDQFEFRRKITIDTTPLGADISENLTDVTFLVRLHSGNFDFSRVRVDGKDLRFVAADDKTLLKYHVERFDSLEELAVVWVRLPKVSGALNQEFIYLYYGNQSAADSQSPDQTFDGQYVGVYHLSETEGIPQDTSTAKTVVSDFNGGLGFPGVIGNGVTFNGIGDKMVIERSPVLNFSGGLTFSTWVKISAEQNAAFLFYQKTDRQTITVGIDGSKIYATVQTDDGKTATTDRSLDLPLNSWNNLTVTISSGERISLYLDGIQMGWVAMPFRLAEKDGKVFIGSSDMNTNYFTGELDEIQISNVVRKAAFIRALFASQGPAGNLLACGEEVTGGGGGLPTFYLGTVMRNITLDGWVVIGVLMILSVLSWIVFLSKTYFMILMERENNSFRESFGSSTHILNLVDRDDDFQNSPLFNVYSEGCGILKKFISGSAINASDHKDGSETRRLSEKNMNAFKTYLEKGFIDEGKRLNSGLVFLTMAISGGPFLGLLGTVWGVMNTFAAMAEAGEANIMAIAPGVASALATTVVGLLVAIPALFAYNYLAGKVKNLISDVSVFIDEFSIKVDELHGERL